MQVTFEIPEQENTSENWQAAAIGLARAARANGFAITIERVSVEPLAMWNTLDRVAVQELPK